MFKKIFFIASIVHIAWTASAQISIIPQPASLVVSQPAGLFVIGKQTKITAKEEGLQNSVHFLNDYLQEFYGFRIGAEKNAKGKESIYLEIQKEPDGINGSYSLEVKNDGIHIQGYDETGVFYGVQSLIQLLPLVKSNSLQVPYVQIKDAPRFQYRGLHLDVARHFFPVSFIKKYIDYLALHKMNYFHWHLTDDQGWRIEIKKYPELTRVGGFRDGTIIGRYPGTGNDNMRYGGFYTQDEVKEIVRYASERYITVVPEIEMPGHASAALTAYPNFGCTGGPYKVQQTWGVFNDVFCAGNDSVFHFLQNVIDEVTALFPSKYIHVGGDECPKESWKACPKCQKRMKDNGLKNEHELQSYFIQLIEKYINKKGRTIIGWDEILEGGLAPNAVVMSWRGEDGGIAAAKQNHYVIMTPGSHMYLDHSQSKKEDSVTFGGYTSVQKVYSYEPVPAEIPVANEKYVLGAQGNVWTEYIKYPRKVEYQIFPRLSALSEVLWSPKQQRNWDGFEPRLQHQFKRYDFWKVNYSKAFFQEENKQNVATQENVHPQSTKYEWPKEAAVQAKLDHWQDQKFGIILHWGLYAVPGIMESWNLCSEAWIDRDSTIAYEDYKKWYWGQMDKFNPVHFNPDDWAKVAKEAGMRYLVFTTKHHDGFNMFDTKQTDFKISAGPFKNNPKADVAKYVFDAFRKQNFMIGAYYSKPDWHSEYYWWPKYATPDRNNNYDIRKYPWRWNKYKEFTYNQVSELMHGYGSIDILWLDGGWVRPLETVNEEVRSWGAHIPEWSQDIDMPKIAAMARQAQPGLLMVDRTVHGPYENYQTPEQRIPANQLDHPWESCMTLANNWGYVPNDQYKTPTKVIHTLIEVVAKGGSLLLGVGPKPDGTLPEEAVVRLKEVGKWVNKNGAALYGTRITQKFHDGNTWFTQNVKDGTRYALVCIPEQQSITKEITWQQNLPKKGSKMKLLATGETVKWKTEGDKVIVSVPSAIINSKEGIPALAFSFTPAD